MTIKYPSIAGFKEVIRKVKERATYRGKDADGNSIYEACTLPTISFNGTVKIHGTNAGIRYTKADDSLVPQSRERDLSLTSDNAGFYVYVMQNDQLFRSIAKQMIGDAESVVIYGEWCGKGTQKGVAISEVDKLFAVFGVRVITGEDERWFDTHELEYQIGVSFALSALNEHRVYLITQFPTYEITINFNEPEMSQNKLVELTIAVEDECPVGKFFGVSGVGEGIVWSHNSDEYGFLQMKVKGEKHSNSKVKTIAPIDEESFKAAKDFAETYTTQSRMEQGLHVMKAEQMLEIEAKNVGAFLKWITGDIFKEEQAAVIQNNLDPKKIAKEITNIARRWYFEQI